MYGNNGKLEQREYVSVPDVLAVSNGMVLICELPGGRRIGVPFDQIGTTSEVRKPGERGLLSVLRWFAEEHKLPTTASPFVTTLA
jgi:hypothetical protein